jgi:hypothetical protein
MSSMQALPFSLAYRSRRWQRQVLAPSPQPVYHQREFLIETKLGCVVVLLETTPGFDHGFHAHGQEFFDGRLMEHYAPP